MLKTNRTFSLSQEAIGLLTQLSAQVANGNRSATLEFLIKSASVEAGVSEIPHLGYPTMGWADDQGNPRCHPNFVQGVCPKCYPEGVCEVHLNIDGRQTNTYRYPHGWEIFSNEGIPRAREVVR